MTVQKYFDELVKATQKHTTETFPSVALAQLDEVIKQASSISQISNEKSKDLAQLRDAFDAINQKYDSLPWFQKTVQLFSLYRMLSENNMCQSTK